MRNSLRTSGGFASSTKRCSSASAQSRPISTSSERTIRRSTRTSRSTTASSSWSGWSSGGGTSSASSIEVELQDRGGGNPLGLGPGDRRRDPAAVRLVTDDEDGRAPAADGVLHAFDRGAWRHALVGLEGHAELSGELLGRLTCAEERAREQRVDAHAAGREPPGELARLDASCGG